MRRLRLALILLAGFAAATAPDLAAGASTVRNLVISTTTLWHKTDVEVSLQIRQDTGPTAVATNSAYATSLLCNGCYTVSLAYQIDLVGGTTNTVVPLNRSEAFNRYTVNSQTLAMAQQFVIATGGWNVSLTPSAIAEIQGLVNGLRSEALTGTPVSTVATDATNVTAQINGILQSSVVSQAATIAPAVGDGGSQAMTQQPVADVSG